MALAFGQTQRFGSSTLFPTQGGTPQLVGKSAVFNPRTSTFGAPQATQQAAPSRDPFANIPFQTLGQSLAGGRAVANSLTGGGRTSRSSQPFDFGSMGIVNNPSGSSRTSFGGSSRIGGGGSGFDPRAAALAEQERAAILDLLGGERAGLQTPGLVNTATQGFQQLAGGQLAPFAPETINMLMGREFSAVGGAQQRAQKQSRQSLASRGLLGGGIEQGANRRIASQGAAARQEARSRILPEALLQNFMARERGIGGAGQFALGAAAARGPLTAQEASLRAQTQFRGGAQGGGGSVQNQNPFGTVRRVSGGTGLQRSSTAGSILQ